MCGKHIKWDRSNIKNSRKLNLILLLHINFILVKYFRGVSANFQIYITKELKCKIYYQMVRN